MYAWSLSWDVLWYLMGRNLCFNRRHWLIDMIPRSRNWTSDFAHVQTANSTGSYGSVWEKHLPNSDGFSDGESPIKNNSLQEKCDFVNQRLVYYIILMRYVFLHYNPISWPHPLTSSCWPLTQAWHFPSAVGPVPEGPIRPRKRLVKHK